MLVMTNMSTADVIYQQLFPMIRQDKREVGGDLQPKASEADIAQMESLAQQELKASAPSSYIRFLRNTNGLSWAGVAIYGTSESPIAGFPNRLIDGFVESNTRFRQSWSGF